MESVIQKIQQARTNENKIQAGTYITEVVVYGCHVKMHFEATDDNKAMAAIQSMLMSAHLNSVLTPRAGGECS